MNKSFRKRDRIFVKIPVLLLLLHKIILKSKYVEDFTDSRETGLILLLVLLDSHV